MFLRLGIEPSFHVCCPPVLTNRLPKKMVMSAHHQRQTLDAVFAALKAVKTGEGELLDGTAGSLLQLPRLDLNQEPQS